MPKGKVPRKLLETRKTSPEVKKNKILKQTKKKSNKNRKKIKNKNKMISLNKDKIN